jgi:sugar/nucleoside kinase (ribokinase family)
MDWVYLNHILEGAEEIQKDLVDLLAHEKPRLTWNPGGRQIHAGIAAESSARLLASTDLLLLNHEEALTFTRQESVEAAFRILLAHGVKRICVTDGKRGVTATDGKRLYRCPCDSSISVVDTTGAGDAFGTGMTWALLTGKDFPTALRAGTLNAASVIGAIGAQRGLLTETLMAERLRRTDLAVTDQPL